MLHHAVLGAAFVFYGRKNVSGHWLFGAGTAARFYHDLGLCYHLSLIHIYSVPEFLRKFDYTVEHYSIIERARPNRKEEVVKG